MNIQIKNTHPSVFLFVLALWVVVVIGWVLNIVKIAQMDAILSSGVGLLRLAGIFLAPLGAVMGLFV